MHHHHHVTEYNHHHLANVLAPPSRQLHVAAKVMSVSCDINTACGDVIVQTSVGLELLNRE